MADLIVLTFEAPAIALAAGDDGRTLRGLAVPFGVPSSMHSFQNRAVRHRFAAGAFARTIGERGDKVRLMAMHDTRSFPIGRATELREEADGLHATFHVADTARGDEALTLVREGIVTGLSVGVLPISNRYGDEHGRVIEHTEVSLREISLVDEPAFAEAGVFAAEQRAGMSPYEARRRLAILERA